MQANIPPIATRKILGNNGISTLKVAVTGPGLQNKLSRMLEQLGWRQETRVSINGMKQDVVGDRFSLNVVDVDEGGTIATNITSAVLDQIEIPLVRNSSRLRELGGGRWQIGRDVIDIIQPAGEARLSWP